MQSFHNKNWNLEVTMDAVKVTYDSAVLAKKMADDVIGSVTKAMELYPQAARGLQSGQMQPPDAMIKPDSNIK